MFLLIYSLLFIFLYSIFDRISKGPVFDRISKGPVLTGLVRAPFFTRCLSAKRFSIESCFPKKVCYLMLNYVKECFVYVNCGLGTR